MCNPNMSPANYAPRLVGYEEWSPISRNTHVRGSRQRVFTTGYREVQKTNLCDPRLIEKDY